jgi:magnesium transporter
LEDTITPPEKQKDPKDQKEPWQELLPLVENGDLNGIRNFLELLPDGDTPRVVSRLPNESQVELFQLLSVEEAARCLERMPEVQAIEVVGHLPTTIAADILDELPSDVGADIVAELDTDFAEAVYAEMSQEDADDLRELSNYEWDEAGGLMITELLSYPADFSVQSVIADMRDRAEEYRDYQVQYAYVIDADGKILGVLRLRDLLLASRFTPIRELMIPNPRTIGDHATLDELREFFDDHGYLGVPVVNDDSKLVGVVLRTDVEAALDDRSGEDYRKSQGLAQEEIRTMPLLVRSRRRLSWLSINIVLNLVAASVIAFYQDVLAQAIALAVFIPIISDMSGCSGNQSVAVSMRELNMGLLRPKEIMRVVSKELTLGMINGLALGTLIALLAGFWQQNPYLGLVVGVAMAVNTLIAVVLGGVVPLVLKLLKFDPALAAGPILTTVTDLCGFFLILSLASTMIDKL